LRTRGHAEFDVVNIARLVEIVLLGFAIDEDELGLLPGIIWFVIVEAATSCVGTGVLPQAESAVQ
jgi:hypothetical protein